MARRKRLMAPSPADLARLEAELDPAGGQAPRRAPIAQVAAESALQADARDPATRAEAARDRADASRLREAESAGRLILDLPLDDIAPDALVRDRVSLPLEELEELTRSIGAHGVRLPIEVFPLDASDAGGPSYGLLSGYRRYKAVHELSLQRQDPS